MRSIHYPSGKANVVADDLSQKERLNMLTMTKELFKEFEKLEIEVCEKGAVRKYYIP